MSEKLYDIISKVFSVPLTEINDESSPETIESWDSFNGLVLVDDLESNFNVKFTVSEIMLPLVRKWLMILLNFLGTIIHYI